MLRLKHYAEWLYYGFWYCIAWAVLCLPHAVTSKPTSWGWKLRQPYYWIVQQGWIFPYLYTLDERKAMSSNAEVSRERSESA